MSNGIKQMFSQGYPLISYWNWNDRINIRIKGEKNKSGVCYEFFFVYMVSVLTVTYDFLHLCERWSFVLQCEKIMT